MPSSYRALLACDLDGTLLDPSSVLSDEVVDFLRELEGRGVGVLFATGRRRASAAPFVARAGLHLPCIVQNGALVHDPRSGAVLRRRVLEPRIVAQVVRHLETADLDPLVYTDAEPPGPQELFVGEPVRDPTGFLATYLPYVGAHCTRVPRGSLRPAHGVTRITAHHERDVLERMRAELVSLLPGELRTLLGYDQGHRVHRLEVLHPEADKADALLWVAGELGLSRDRLVAVGDDGNDVEMLKAAAHSYAAPGALDAARRAARVAVEGVGPAAVVAALRDCPLLRAAPESSR